MIIIYRCYLLLILLFIQEKRTNANEFKEKPTISSLTIDEDSSEEDNSIIGEVRVNPSKNIRPNLSNIGKIVKDITTQCTGCENINRKRIQRNALGDSFTALRKKLNKVDKKEVLATAAQLKENNGNNNTRSNIGHLKIDYFKRGTDKIRELHLQQHVEEVHEQKTSPATDCDFEHQCHWTWKNDTKDGFFITSAKKIAENDTGPKADANGKTAGNFLMLRVPATTRVVDVVSPSFGPTKNSCRLQLFIFQQSMQNGEIHIVGEKSLNQTGRNKTLQWLVDSITGLDTKIWMKYEFIIGKISENFSIILHVAPPPTYNPAATVAFDKISLIDCYHRNEHNCDFLHYRCKGSNECINSTSVCDLTEDCPFGDDEKHNCDLMPYEARCTFEEDWCGWENIKYKDLEWVRHNGSTPTNFTGPKYDNTYMNSTGKYIFVNMLKDDAKFASTALLKSKIFNPPPRVHGNASSPYYNSCTIRFYLHQTGKHRSGISVQVTELKGNATHELFWSTSDQGDKWVRKILILPNITHKYLIDFEVKRGVSYISDIAIDDISLAPECFGINIPKEHLNHYNYWNPIDPDAGIEVNKAFVNETYYRITTCGTKGRFGPSPQNCSNTYNATAVEVTVLNASGMKGVQKWTAPREEYYSLIVSGASGGQGGSAIGSSRGSMVRAVVELMKGQHLYVMVGQQGANACVKTTGYQEKSPCYQPKNNSLSDIPEIRQMDVHDGGGGGGGATVIFLRNTSKHSIPVVIAAGGGGLGLGKYIDDGRHHGQGIDLSRPSLTGKSIGNKSAGRGGSWSSTEPTSSSDPKYIQMLGQSLSEGGIGGKACYNSTNGRGDGGFGGGGGGCNRGGGGGGYIGGYGYINGESMNGEGGYSFFDSYIAVHGLSKVVPSSNAGPGEILIIPAVPGCGCDYRCVALNAERSETVCICPKLWELHEDGKRCILTPVAPTEKTLWVVIGLLIILVLITVAFGVVCVMLYNRYQQKASGILRRKMLTGPDLQLDRLRMASDSMMTEYNPNYEFGGVVYTLRDLKDIPREQLRLVKALGQGAFGEVYQGFYRQRPCDTVEMPVAVKTLPELSTNQAEMDFLMEALIMSKFRHPNIVHFIGVCFDKHPRFIVLELLAGGDLKNFLRESRPKPERGSPLTMKDLILIAVDVAKGCKYLEDNRFIHRDIAARNCLLTTKGPGRVVKIADFGMSRDVYRSDYYRKGGKAMLPIKWMPPEAFMDGIFTSKTDVWSFGVLLWEIMAMGIMPYAGCANREVMQMVTSGGRLDPPNNCPGPIYGVMTQCWHPAPEHRPTFNTILERLGYCVQDPQVMNSPLPVFDNRPPSNEKDNTIMRPSSSDENCLQVSQSSEYLIPNHTSDIHLIGSTSSVEKLLPENSDSWETSFILPHSRSTQPLLQQNSTEKNLNCEEAASVDKLLTIENNANLKISPISLQNHTIGNHNNNIKNDVSSLKSGVSLDAGALVMQSMTPTQKKYANVNTGDGVTLPCSVTNNYLNNSNNTTKFFNDSEINC